MQVLLLCVHFHLKYFRSEDEVLAANISSCSWRNTALHLLICLLTACLSMTMYFDHNQYVRLTARHCWGLFPSPSYVWRPKLPLLMPRPISLLGNRHVDHRRHPMSLATCSPNLFVCVSSILRADHSNTSRGSRSSMPNKPCASESANAGYQ